MIGSAQIEVRCTKQVRSWGLSLLELLVVLTILIALGGIVVATLPGVLRRTEVATAAANLPQIDSSIRQNLILNQGQIGNRFDALVVGTSSLDGEIPTFLGGREQFQTVGLTAADVAALKRVGIVELVPAVPTPDNATFSSHDQAPVKLAADSKVCSLGGPDLELTLRRNWNIALDPGSKFLVFGIGGQSTLVGAGSGALFPEAPVHFSGNQSAGPQAMYSRYLIVVQLRTLSERTVEAQYVGTCFPASDGIRTMARELESHYSSGR
jgi:type II secretory pathway pseudopilin PulG